MEYASYFKIHLWDWRNQIHNYQSKYIIIKVRFSRKLSIERRNKFRQLFLKFHSTRFSYLFQDRGCQFDVPQVVGGGEGLQFPTESDLDNYVVNLSSRPLSLTERQALSKGLRFCEPRNRGSTKQTLIDTEFENLQSQLDRLTPYEDSETTRLKARLVNLSKTFTKESVPRHQNLPPTPNEALLSKKKTTPLWCVVLTKEPALLFLIKLITSPKCTKF